MNKVTVYRLQNKKWEFYKQYCSNCERVIHKYGEHVCKPKRINTLSKRKRDAYSDNNDQG